MHTLENELRAVFRGEILADDASLEHYSKDGSIFRVKPWSAVLPKDAMDIVALVRWMREKKENDPENPKLSITARGRATDQAGGPLNEGIVIRFPGYLDRILEIGQNFVRVEPGALFGAVNKELEKHGRFLPTYPASAAFSTIGGAVANNAAGEKSIKYGSMRLYVKALKMVLASGTEVSIVPINHAELNLKKQQANFEGDIYRGVDELIKREKSLLDKTRPKVNKYSTGYNLWDVSSVTNEGQIFDLTQLISGSQGTLGVLTEVSLLTPRKPLYTGLLLSFFDDLKKAGEATAKLVKLDPSALEMVDHFLLEIVQRERPEMLKGLIPPQAPQIAIICEFDGDDIEEIKEELKIAEDAIKEISYGRRSTTDKEEQDRLWQVRRSALIVIEGIRGKKKALPFIEDVTVPPERFPEYISKLYEILRRHQVKFAVWGHAGNGNAHVQPFLDIGDSGDRAKLFAITDEVFDLAAKLDGVFSGEHNDGIMRTPYLSKLYPPELLKVWREVKKIFDPQNIFNPGKKIAIDLAYAKSHLRDEYEVGPPPKKKGEEEV